MSRDHRQNAAAQHSPSLSRQCAAAQGVEDVIVSQDLAVVAYMCERLMVMRDASVIEELTVTSSASATSVATPANLSAQPGRGRDVRATF